MNKNFATRMEREYKVYGDCKRFGASHKEGLYKDGFRFAVDAKSLIDKIAMSHSCGGHRLMGTKNLEKCVKRMIRAFGKARAYDRVCRIIASAKKA